MKGNKIMATLIVLVMVLSTLVVLFNNFEVNAKEAGLPSARGVPGVDVWQGTLRASPNNRILNMTSPNLVAGTTRDLSFNGTIISTDCYLYYPQYRSKDIPNNYVWVNWTRYSSTVISASDATPSLSSVNLNVSGLWFIAPTGGLANLITYGVNMSNMSFFYTTGSIWKKITGWFWVNSSAWTVSLDKSSLNFGENQTLTVTVKDGSGNDLAAGTTGFIDMWKIENSHYILVYHNVLTDMSIGWAITAAKLYDYTNGHGAGTYAFSAYSDNDPTAISIDYAQRIYGSPGTTNRNFGWNTSFGNESTWLRFMPTAPTTKIYKYDLSGVVSTATWITPTYRYHNNATLGCGPFAPPKYLADYVNFTVETNEPTLSMASSNQSQWWSFDGGMNVSCKKFDGKNLTTTYRVYIYNASEGNVTSYFATDGANAGGKNGWIRTHNGYVIINCTSWGMDGSTVFGENGSWSIRILKNASGNATLEWDGNITFDVSGASGLRFNWINDQGVIPGGKPNDGVIPSVPSKAQQALEIQFQIINKNHKYRGSSVGARNTPILAAENITLSGDALFLSGAGTSLADYPGTYYFRDSTTWHVWLTPTMALNGGHITITADWGSNGTISETLQIGGALTASNGSVVSVTPSQFIVGVNTTFTVTVTDPSGTPYNNANVSFWWIVDSDGTAAGNLSGRLGYRTARTTNGQYSFFLNASQQTHNQTTTHTPPGPFTNTKAPRNISVYVDTPSVGYGYALIKMKPQNSLKVTMQPSTFMAGQRVSKVWVNTTKVDSTGNKTGYPPHGDLIVQIFNSTGKDVTDSIGTALSGMISGNDNITITSGVYLQKPGVYTVYAHNNTWNSEGHNATLTVQAVNVTCDLSELIWKVDNNVTGTFTVKYNGLPVNGTLLIDNMTDNITYNGTWYLSNSTPNIGTTGLVSHPLWNTSIQITITNGVGTVNNITAKGLPASANKKNITYLFKPKTSGSAWAHTTGITPVKIANVAVTPATVVLNEAADLTITVTGRSAGLDDVWVSIGGAVDAQNGTTTSDGKITFSTVPTKTGKITIAIENRTSDTYVRVTNWRLYIDPISQINEDSSFTVMVRNGSATGPGLSGVQVIAGSQTGTTDASGQVTFTAPSVGRNGATLTITATKDGYASATITTTVNNVPKLIIIPPSAKVAGTQTFTVTIANDDGAGVAGASVTFNGATVFSGANGITELKAPDVKDKNGADYQITATFTGYTNATPITIHIAQTPGIPGFELLTLVAAIGVAFLLLRRRQK